MPVQGSKIFYEFDPFEALGRQKPKGKVREAKRQIADFLLNEIIDYVHGTRSPVSGEPWKATLSKEYRKRKSSLGGSGVSDMELFGDMLDALSVSVNRSGNIEVRVTGKQGDKARGHNQHSGDSRPDYLPKRRFIPDKGQAFKKPILDGIKRIIDNISIEEDDGEDPSTEP